MDTLQIVIRELNGNNNNGEVNYNMFHVYADYVTRLIQLCDRLQNHNTINANISVEPKIQWLKDNEIMNAPDNNIVSDIEMQLVDLMVSMYEFIKTTLDESEHQNIDDFAMTKFPGFVSVMGNDNKILNLDTIQDLSELLFWILYMSMPISICHKIIKIRSTLSDNIIVRTDRKASRERSMLQMSFVKPEIAEELIKIIGTDKYTQLLLQPYASNYKYIELLISYGKLNLYIDKGWINIGTLIEHRFTFGMSLLHLLIFEEEINLCKTVHITYDYLYQSIPEDALPLSSLSEKIKDIVIHIFENVVDDNRVYPYELLGVYSVDKLVNVIPSWLLIKQSKKIIYPQKYNKLFCKMIETGKIDREFVRQNLNNIIQLSLTWIYSEGETLDIGVYDIISSLKQFLDKELIESTFKLGDKEFPTATLIANHGLFNTVLANTELYDAYIGQLKKYPTFLTPLLFGQNCIFDWDAPQYGFSTLLMLLKSANTINVANAFCKSMWSIIIQRELGDYINQNTEVNMTTSDIYVYDEFVKLLVSIHENQKTSVGCMCFIMTNLEIGNKYTEDVFIDDILDIRECITNLSHLLLRNSDNVVEFDIDYYAEYMKKGAKANCLKLINKYSSFDLFSNFDTIDIIDIFQIYHEENHPLLHLIEQQMFDYRKIFGLRPEGAKIELTVRYNLRIMDVIRNAYKVWEREDVTNNALMNIGVIGTFDELRDLPRILYCLKTLYNVTPESLYRHPSAFAKIIDTKDCLFIQSILSTFDITSCEISQELKQKLNETVRNIIDIQTTTDDELQMDLLKILSTSNVISVHVLGDEYYNHIERLLVEIPILFRTLVDQGTITQETLLKENIVMNMLLYYEHISIDSSQIASRIKSLRNTITTAHFEKMIEHNINCLISLFSKKIFIKDELLEKDQTDHTLIDKLFSAITSIQTNNDIVTNKTQLINIVEAIIDNYDCDVFRQYTRNIIELGGTHKIIGRIDISEIIGKYNTIKEFVSMITSTGIERLIKCLKALIEHPNEIHYNYINDILKVSIIPLFTSGMLSPESMIQCLIDTDKKFYIELIVSMGNHADKLAIQHVQKCIEESDINNDIVINAFRHGLIELNNVLINKYPDFIFIDDIPMSNQNIMKIIDESTTNDIIFDKLTNSSYSQKMTQRSMNVLQLMLTKYLETDFNLFIDAVGKISCDYNTIGFGLSSEKNNKIRDICNDNPLVMANLITGKFFKDIKDVLSIYDRHGNYTVSHITNETIIKSALEVLTIDDLKVNNKLGNPRLMAFLNNNIGYKIITGKDAPYDIKDLETIVNKYGMNIYHYMMENNDFDKIPKKSIYVIGS